MISLGGGSKSVHINTNWKYKFFLLVQTPIWEIVSENKVSTKRQKAKNSA